MATKSKSKEVVTQSGEVLPAHMSKRMEAAKGKAQRFSQDDLIIPRLQILQDLSDQIKTRSDHYVDGAKAGDIFNNVTGTLTDNLMFVPSYYSVRYIAWKPRPDGGLVDMDFPEADLVNLQKETVGKWVGEIEREGKRIFVEVIRTPEWAGIAVGPDGRPLPVVISFASTKGKSARKINTTIELTEIEGEEGPYVPAPFFHLFSLTTALETSGDNEWFGWKVDSLGFCTDEHLVDRAEKLRDSMLSGETVAADEA